MEPLDKAFVVVPVVEPRDPRRGLVRAPNEFVRMVPYAFSWPRMLLYCILVVLSFGTLLALSVWFPQVFTHLARQRLPHSSLGRAHYVLILVHEDGLRSLWVEVKLQHPPKPVGPGFWARQLRWCRRSGSKDSSADKVAAAGKSGTSAAKQPWVWFEFKKHRYAFDADKGEFERYLATANEPLSDVTARVSKGLSAASDAPSSEVEHRKGLFGPNVVDVDEPSVALLLFTKIMHPFYLFQIFSVAVWFVEQYTVYAIVILVLSACSLLWETFCEVSNTWRLRKLVRSEHRVTVVRNGVEAAIDERDLVPGDIVAVAAGPVCADMLLLSGMCEADEASITGEALPVAKTPASGHGHTTDAHHKSSVLYTGSRITRVHEGTGACKGCGKCGGSGECARTDVYRAVVLRTGFATGKGELFRSILHPRPLTFEFERDSYRYLFVLVAIALAAFIKRLVDAADMNVTFGYTALHSLDLITIAVPPALPLVLSSGINFALGRLRLRGVACMDARRINLCGQLSCFCFDKTGTLTGEHFKFAGVEDIVRVEDVTRFQPVDLKSHVLPTQLRAAMATCHDLSADGQGLMLDKEMFAQTQCRLAHSKHTNTIHVTSDMSSELDDAFPGYEILKRFPFDSSLQRSSVVVRNLDTFELVVFVKGSPDAIRGLASGCPVGFADVTRTHATEGHYCIAFASKTMPEDKTLDLESRAAVESELELLALLYFTNELKPESAGVVAKLKAAELDVRMITGDGPFTALQVAQELKMGLRTSVAVVDVSERTGDVQLWNVEAAKSEARAGEWEHFTGASISRLLNAYDIAITGPALDKLRKECENETIVHLVRNTRIYARIQPQQKAWIVEQLMDMGHIVGMCGDGTNDCGALKAAHVGLALLSGVEASLVASFTSTRKSIEDVPMLIREGRCAIMTSFLAFKFMVLYPLIQLAMATTLAHFDLVLTNNQYVWDDMAIVLGLSISMLATGASTELTATRPPRTLFAPTIACSIAGQVGIFLAFFAGHFALLKQQPTSWFCRIQDAMAYLSGDRSVPSSCAVYLAYNSVDNEYSFEGTSVWLFGHMLYISVAAAFNINDPFRLPFYRNWLFTALLLAVAGVNLWFLLDTSGVVDDTFQLMAIPFAYRWKLLTMFLGHAGTSVIWEFVATRGLPRFERPAWVQRLSASCGLQ